VVIGTMYRATENSVVWLHSDLPSSLRQHILKIQPLLVFIALNLFTFLTSEPKKTFIVSCFWRLTKVILEEQKCILANIINA